MLPDSEQVITNWADGPEISQRTFGLAEPIPWTAIKI
jgi:hypothetical protein